MKRKYRIISAAAAAIMTISGGASAVMPGLSYVVNASAFFERSGNCGNSASFAYDGSGTLTVSGTGMIRERRFDNEGDIKDIVISEGITAVDRFTFFNCYDLKTLKLPSTMKTIRLSAFQQCAKLESVTFAGNDPVDFDAASFMGCSALKSITVPVGSTVSGLPMVLDKNGKIPTVFGDTLIYFRTGDEDTEAQTAAPVKSTSNEITVTFKSNSADIDTVKYGDTVLTPTDYSLMYYKANSQKKASGTPITKPVNPGTYVAVLNLRGEYSGSVSAAFTIYENSTSSKTKEDEPAGVVFTNKYNGEQISWTKVEGAKYYNIFVKKSDGKYHKVVSVSSPTVLISSLTNGKSYQMLIKAVMKNGISTTITDGRFTLKADFKPLPTAKSTVSSVTLSWPKVEGAALYRIYRYSNGTFTAMTETKDTSSVIKALSSGKTYSYAVSAFIGGNWTELKKSDVVSIKTK